MKKPESSRPVRLKIGVDGDRRLAENVIQEVRAVARRLGVKIANVEIIRQVAAGGKARKLASRRKLRRP